MINQEIRLLPLNKKILLCAGNFAHVSNRRDEIKKSRMLTVKNSIIAR
jgi:hypothetical protein